MRAARAYPTKAAIQRAVETARSVGLDVAGYEVKPDGTIRVFELRAPANDAIEGLVERE